MTPATSEVRGPNRRTLARRRSSWPHSTGTSWRPARPSPRKTDAEFMAPWTLKRNGRDLFTMPRLSVVRTLLLNHLIHHRGQLSVYLRLNNVPLPPVYGPTADERG